MPLAIPVCLLLWLIVLRLHEIRIMLQLQPDFQKNKKQNPDMVSGRHGHPGPWTISSNTLLMSSWTLRKLAAEGRAWDTAQPALSSCVFHTYRALALHICWICMCEKEYIALFKTKKRLYIRFYSHSVQEFDSWKTQSQARKVCL